MSLCRNSVMVEYTGDVIALDSFINMASRFEMGLCWEAMVDAGARAVIASLPFLGILHSGAPALLSQPQWRPFWLSGYRFLIPPSTSGACSFSVRPPFYVQYQLRSVTRPTRLGRLLYLGRFRLVEGPSLELARRALRRVPVQYPALLPREEECAPVARRLDVPR